MVLAVLRLGIIQYRERPICPLTQRQGIPSWLCGLWILASKASDVDKSEEEKRRKVSGEFYNTSLLSPPRRQFVLLAPQPRNVLYNSGLFSFWGACFFWGWMLTNELTVVLIKFQSLLLIGLNITTNWDCIKILNSYHERPFYQQQYLYLPSLSTNI